MDYSDTMASMDNPVTTQVMESMSKGKTMSLIVLNMCRKCNQNVLHIFRWACSGCTKCKYKKLSGIDLAVLKYLESILES